MRSGQSCIKLNEDKEEQILAIDHCAPPHTSDSIF
jgi:hypothetical protein